MTRQLMTRRHWLRSAGAVSITAVGARAGLTPARATKRPQHQSSPIFDATSMSGATTPTAFL